MRIFPVALIALGICVSAHAQPLELASPFVDHAIVQRQMPVPVWGWAKAESTVTVSFAGQTKTATADERGKWKLQLDPLEASAEGRVLSVKTEAGETLTVKDLLVGEVWFASGQSNMDWLAGKSLVRDLAGRYARSKVEVPVREYAVDTGSSLFVRSRAQSTDGWKSSRQAGGFSALALAFAAELHEKLGVPVGIVRSTHGATPVETWTAYEGFTAHPKLRDLAEKIRVNDPRTPHSKAAYAKFFEDLRQWQVDSEKIINRGGNALPRPQLPGIAPEWKGASRMYNKKIAPLVPYAIRGAIWCQGTHNADDGRIYAAKMEALVNGWRKNWNRPNLPFYFTQMQCYGAPDPTHVGFADIREAQRLFFMNAEHVGMVPQYDLNPKNPGGIHYQNKLDPGKRLARWALAHEYGKTIAYTGPIYHSHTIKEDTVRVKFEQRGPGGGLIVASKGEQGTDSYVEPAKPTPGEPLRHFRLAGADRKWHDAEAVIDGDSVVVTSKAVPKPVGVQYAYSASPIGANLYNAAGLPATPFAYYDGKQLFKEDDAAIVAAEKAEAERKWGKKSYLLPMSLLRDRGVLQRDRVVPIWGHGVPGTTVTVEFGKQKKTAKVDEFEKWLVKLDPMPASTEGRVLKITDSAGADKSVKDIVVGDVWMITGSRQLDGQTIRAPKDGKVTVPAQPNVREFRIKTKARRFPRPRKLRMEIGGGKYVASWNVVDFDDMATAPSVAAYHFAVKVKQPGVPLGIVTLGAENPPLTWVSYASMQTLPGFEKERDELNLAYPNTDSCKRAIVQYIETVKQYNRKVAALLEAGEELPTELAENVPAFPQPYYNQWVSRTETATHTYNFCISPNTPYAVRGVVWVPGEDNIDEDVTRYPRTLGAYAKSLAATYGQDKVAFVYAQPSAKLVEGMVDPKIPGAASVVFDEWPKSLQELAGQLGRAAAAPVASEPSVRENFKVGGRPAFIIMPPKSQRVAGPTPWVWYAPTLGKGLPGGAEKWMFERFHRAGIAVAGIDVGESYGSPKGRAHFESLYAELTTKRGFGNKPVLLARSRGGLMLYSWAVEHADKVGGIAGIYPVCNIASYPGVARAAGAYEMTAEQLQAKLAEHNPIARLAPLAKAQVPIYHIHGDVDKVVPNDKNSAIVAAFYKEADAPMTLHVPEGQGHNMWPGFFQHQPLVDFVIKHAKVVDGQ